MTLNRESILLLNFPSELIGEPLPLQSGKMENFTITHCILLFRLLHTFATNIRGMLGRAGVAGITDSCSVSQ